MELASCGQSVVLELSRYIPRESTQKTELKVDLRAVALLDQEEARSEEFSVVARSALLTNVYVWRVMSNRVLEDFGVEQTL